jgi:hypothetical protein
MLNLQRISPMEPGQVQQNVLFQNITLQKEAILFKQKNNIRCIKDFIKELTDGWHLM